MTELFVPYSKSNPFNASLKARYNLCRPGSNKNTLHLVLDLKGSGMTYQVGDSIGIFPSNDPALVQQTLRALHARGDEIIHEKHTGRPYTLRAFLTSKATITEMSRMLIVELAKRQVNRTKAAVLESLLLPENREQYTVYVDTTELWQALQDNEEVSFTPQEMCDRLLPLRCRFYSIASSQKEVGEEVHLAVAMLEYDVRGYLKKGVCTHYLCNLIPFHESVIPVFIQPSHGFFLPEEKSKPIIMVGPGTGVAPYRAFMQERMKTGATEKNWLFFGEWNRDYDFFYEEYWMDLHAQGKLRVDVAFSRDQEHKIYVQHKLQEHAHEVFQWLQEGAYFYVCGDAHRMAKDVDTALHHIVQTAGHMTDQEAKAYVKQLKADKRYLRDVY